MDITDYFKYIASIATTLLAIYALTNDFKKEIFDQEGKSLGKKLTKAGKRYIVILIFLGILSAIISVSADIRKVENNKVAEKTQKKLDSIRTSWHAEDQDALQKNLHHVKGLLDTLNDFKKIDSINSETSLSNQLQFAQSLDDSKQKIINIQDFSKSLFSELDNKVESFKSNINDANTSIKSFYNTYENAKDEFDKIHLYCALKVSYWGLCHGEIKVDHNAYKIEDFESNDRRGTLRELERWIYDNNYV